MSINTKVISLGGAGGCGIAMFLRTLNYKSYPYDWLYSTQSFIINSFFDKTLFIQRDKRDIDNHALFYDDKIVRVTASSIHDELHELDCIKSKYDRRFLRLYSDLQSNDNIIFVRLLVKNNIKHGITEYNNIIYNYNETFDIIDEWIDFINKIKLKYNKYNIKLILIDHDDKNEKINDNIYICGINGWMDYIKNIIDL